MLWRNNKRKVTLYEVIYGKKKEFTFTWDWDLALPLVRKMSADLISANLIKVEPMSLPSGLFYLDLDYKYEKKTL